MNVLGSPYEGSPPEIKSFLCPSIIWSFSKALEALGTWTSDTIAPASATAMSRKRSSSLAQQAWLLPAAVMRVGWFVSLCVGYSLRPFAAPDGIQQRAGLSVWGELVDFPSWFLPGSQATHTGVYQYLDPSRIKQRTAPPGEISATSRVLAGLKMAFWACSPLRLSEFARKSHDLHCLYPGDRRILNSALASAAELI